MKPGLILAAALLLAAPAGAQAANAGQPYQNIDPRNDAGNATGDAQTDRLNQAQLSQLGAPVRRHSWWDRGPRYTPPGRAYGGGLRAPGYAAPPPYDRPPAAPPGYPY